MGVSASKRLYELQNRKAEERKRPLRTLAQVLDGLQAEGIKKGSPENGERLRHILNAAVAAGVSVRELKQAGVTEASLKKARNGSDPDMTDKARQQVLALLFTKI